MGSNKDLILPGELGNLGEIGSKLNNNGGNYVEDEEIGISPLVNVVVSVEGIGSSSLSSSLSLSADVDKRKGLRKWRRIPREVAKKIGSNSLLVQQMMMSVNDDHPDFASSASSTVASELNGDDLVAVLVDDHERIGRIGPEKKARSFEIEKDNSNENLTVGVLGSDSGRSNFVFVQGSSNVSSKGGSSGSFAKRDEESSNDKDLSVEAQLAFVKSYAESDDVSLAADNIGKHEELMEHDFVVESIKRLQSAQEELEKEVQKWRDVGKDDPLILNNPIHEILELKDAKITELQLALSSEGKKTELEDYLMKIIQADVENVVITSTTKRLTEGPLREVKHKLQQKNVSAQGVQATKGTLETKNDLKKLQNRVCRFTSCLIIQLILLLVTLFLNFYPHNDNVEVVPT